jgi:hypothetical protein
MATLKEVTQAVEAFNDTCQRHARFGAVDTEPRSVFFHLCRKAAEGGDPQVPMTASTWELYSDMPGSGVAAMALYQAARRVISQIRDCPIGQLRSVRELF